MHLILLAPTPLHDSPRFNITSLLSLKFMSLLITFVTSQSILCILNTYGFGTMCRIMVTLLRATLSKRTDFLSLRKKQLSIMSRSQAMISVSFTWYFFCNLMLFNMNDFLQIYNNSINILFYF